MAEFIQVATILRELFLPDVVPWPSLLTESNLEKLRVRYKFNEMAHQANNPAGGSPQQIIAQKGEFLADGIPLLVEQFMVQPLIVQFQIAGNSDQADQFAADLGDFFLEIDPRQNYSKSQLLTKTYQTIGVARLSVPFDAMFSKKFSEYLRETVGPSITPEKTQIELRLNNLRWIVSYRPETPDFTYLPKILAIEPRQGSSPSDMLYYTQSPTDYRTHKALVESFESALS
jgi:hypothetical protein